MSELAFNFLTTSIFSIFVKHFGKAEVIIFCQSNFTSLRLYFLLYQGLAIRNLKIVYKYFLLAYIPDRMVNRSFRREMFITLK